ncbi:MAG: alanine racemase [Clostridia bacterium]|nr:alanine racemase [Clostridia bacterium]
MKHINRAWAEIDLDAIENNIREIRRYVTPTAKILGVVKADAYGHGYLEVARTLLENGADALAVACLDEAIQLRRCYIRCPILILGRSCREEAETLVFYDVMPACFEMGLAEAMSEAAVKLEKTAKLHIKIDTGMGRVGYRYADDAAANENTISEILKIAALPNVEIDGIFTHFAVADEDDDEYTYLQFKRFCEVCDRLAEKGLNIPVRHCANSAALIRFPQMHLDMVRPGIILYGKQPSSFVDCGALKLKSAMTFKARITNIKMIEKGASVSYGRRFTADRDTKIATVPVGYADGYSRILSGAAQVIAGGKLCDIVGNICMDQCMIDVTSVNNINIGDEVILFGRGDNIELPVESLAEKMGTINYEILCMIGKRIPRIYIRNGVPDKMHNYLLDSPISG